MLSRRRRAVAAFALVACALVPAGIAAATNVAPLLAWNTYWADIARGKYAAAYQFVGPSARTLTSAQFVAEEKAAHIKQVDYRGMIIASTPTTSTIAVIRLKTVDGQYGCRNWTGTYEMVLLGGRWLIGRSSITPHGCPAANPPPTQPSKGATLYVHDFNGNKLAASAAIFGDPATPANQFEDVQRGSRLIAIKLSLTDDGPGEINSDANADMTLIGSDGQAYTPSFDDVQGCTNFSYGQFTLARGQSENGCVVFDVPNGVTIKRVTFSLTDDSVDGVYWTAP